MIDLVRGRLEVEMRLLDSGEVTPAEFLTYVDNSARHPDGMTLVELSTETAKSTLTIPGFSETFLMPAGLDGREGKGPALAAFLRMQIQKLSSNGVFWLIRSAFERIEKHPDSAASAAEVARAVVLLNPGLEFEAIRWALVYAAVVYVSESIRSPDPVGPVPELKFPTALNDVRWHGATRSIEPLLTELRETAGDDSIGPTLQDRCANHASDGHSLVYGPRDRPRSDPPEPELVYGWIRSTIRLLEETKGLAEEAEQISRHLIEDPNLGGFRAALQSAQDEALADKAETSEAAGEGSSGRRWRAGWIVAGLGAASAVITIWDWMDRHLSAWLNHAIDAMLWLVERAPHA